MEGNTVSAQLLTSRLHAPRICPVPGVSLIQGRGKESATLCLSRLLTTPRSCQQRLRSRHRMFLETWVELYTRLCVQAARPAELRDHGRRELTITQHCTPTKSAWAVNRSSTADQCVTRRRLPPGTAGYRQQGSLLFR